MPTTCLLDYINVDAWTFDGYYKTSGLFGDDYWWHGQLHFEYKCNEGLPLVMCHLCCDLLLQMYYSDEEMAPLPGGWYADPNQPTNWFAGNTTYPTAIDCGIVQNFTFDLKIRMPNPPDAKSRRVRVRIGQPDAIGDCVYAEESTSPEWASYIIP